MFEIKLEILHKKINWRFLWIPIFLSANVLFDRKWIFFWRQIHIFMSVTYDKDRILGLVAENFLVGG